MNKKTVKQSETKKPKTVVKKTSTKKVTQVKTTTPKNIEVKKVERVIEEPKKRKSNSKVTDSEKLYIYGALITIILVLSNSIINIPFELFGYSVKLSTFIYPFTFLLSCVIMKKYGVMEVIEALVVAIVVQMLMFFLRWIIVGNINVGLFVSSFVSFSISQAACLCLYSILIRNKMDTIFYVFLVFTICILFDNGVFLSLLKNFGDSTVEIGSLNISNILKVLISFVISYFITEKEW